MYRKVNTDIIAGIFGLVLSLIFWFSIEEITRLSIMFPQTMVAIMGLVSVGLLVKGFVKPEMREIFAEGNNRRVVVTGAMLFGWALAIPWLGFFVSSLLAMGAVTYYLARARNYVSPGKLAVWMIFIAAEIGFFYYIFVKLLHVPLPEGWLI